MRSRSSRSPIGSVQEYALIHDCRIATDDRPKLHPSEDVALDVDAGRDFDQLKPVRGQFEHTALRHIEHGLPAFHRVVAGKRPVLNLIDELRHLAVLDDAQAAVLDRHLAGGRP